MRGKTLVLLVILLLTGGCGQKEAGSLPSREAKTETRQEEITPAPREPKTTPPTDPPSPAPLSTEQEEDGEALLIEEELLRLINGEREANGLPSLVAEETMGFAAKIRAEEALASLSHTRPDETPYHTAFSEAGFPYSGKWHGENLAVLILQEPDKEPEEVAAALFRQYADSPGHHSNILSEHFAETGVGVCRLKEGESVRYGAAQMFAGR